MLLKLADNKKYGQVNINDNNQLAMLKSQLEVSYVERLKTRRYYKQELM